MIIKQNQIHPLRTLALLGAMAAGLWGCQTDDFAEPSNLSQGELQLTVIDSGYTGHTVNYDNGTLRELPPTRATDAGYRTTFAAGDKIGFYAVNGSTLTATNVCLTLTNVGGVLKWQPPTGTKLSATADRYFAYYPYKASPGGTTASATDADAFFAKVISAWRPAVDQSGASYTAQDLMVGSGTLGTTPENGFYPLTIALTHKMGLAVIKLPADATDVAFNTNIPYTVSANSEYRYLVKPGIATTLSCSFKDGGVARGFVISPTIAGGSYKTYNVSGAPPVSMSFGIDLTLYPTDKTYILPFKTSGTTTYAMTVDWGDGSTDNIVSETDLATAISHPYTAAKEYTITITTSQPDISKEQIPGFKPGSYRGTTNNNRLKLKSLLTPLLNTGEEKFMMCFSTCTNLSGSIPAGLFVHNPQVKDFSFCFSQCSGLTEISAGLFAKNPLVTTFASSFLGCSSLTEIPAGLFTENPLVTTFQACFSQCSGLTSKIPASLFANNSLVTNFGSCFSQCSGLTGEIPAGLFAENPLVTTFARCFSKCRGLDGEIPAGLFAKKPAVDSFLECFDGCSGLTGEIPADLFAENPLVTIFKLCFGGCSGLTGEIPASLFASNMAVKDFESCFSGCTSLAMNANIFCDEETQKGTRFNTGEVITFTSCFEGVGSVVGNAGTAPALWSYTANKFTSSKCFKGIGTVTNQAALDASGAAWK